MVNIKDKYENPSTSQSAPTTPRPLRRDPSLPTSLPTYSKPDKLQVVSQEKPISCRRRFLKYLYNREKKTFCGRTCKNWFSIIIYSVLYVISLAAYSLLFLYGTLIILKELIDYRVMDKVELLTYSENGIGLSGTPASEGDQPIIWYRQGVEDDYKKYINAIDRLLVKNRRKRELSDLGPCGEAPYGYGDKPCVIIKINKQLYWKGKPLDTNSSETKLAPKQVLNWIQRDKKLWNFCEGVTSFDKEHLRDIDYYPNPPGIDPGIFPIDLQSALPVVAIQISNFTIGTSLAIECKLWYEGGPSSFGFVIYIAPDSQVVYRKTIDSEINSG
ncbi:sodium/potassium-transporting ATPase subunit beta-1-like [Bombyx mandarina]|uniref:Sodium/potassium-transporting ATPase subunit beta-1-like n=1 Tax=Bombyx mandarina TaxID=7092 RepID=A0A6J2KPH6_BOMMA|nr:sodium/potassium-transporting ATPase subunit beta-1-like [Bombyx mandarina]